MLVNASGDFVEPLIFTNIKIIVARLFYERDYKSFIDFRLFFNVHAPHVAVHEQNRFPLNSEIDFH